MDRVVEVRLQVLAKCLAHACELDRIAPSGDLRVAVVPPRQVNQRQPAGIIRPAVVGLKGGDEDTGHKLAFGHE